jgi:hypothetical protein
MNNSINANFNRADQIKTSHEGKRVGLVSKLKEPKGFGSRNMSILENRANSTLRNPKQLLAPLTSMGGSDMKNRRMSQGGPTN